MLQAMNTGHDGSLTTLHANSPRDALSRLETMVMYSGIDLPERNIKNQIASAINIIIQASRLQDGSRKVTKVSEIVGMEENVITMQDIFVWEQTGASFKSVMGMHVSTGVRPKFVDRIKARGMDINPQYFDKNHRHTYLNRINQSAGVNMQPKEQVNPRLQAQQPAVKKMSNTDLDILKRLKR